jgi:hypothetical protein
VSTGQQRQDLAAASTVRSTLTEDANIRGASMPSTRVKHQ